MKGSRENRASDAPEQSGWRDAVLSWTTATRMLGLVRSIVHDVLEAQQRIVQLQPEKTRLDRRRHSLAWPERSRRYQLEEEISRAERICEEAEAELDSLGVALLGNPDGQVGFPTLVNDRRAFFSWRPGEATVQFWHFAGEGARRPIPAQWIKSDLRLLGKS